MHTPSSVFLFTGEENYLIDQELQRRKSAFAQKYGSDTIFSYHPENFDPQTILQHCMGSGLFFNKKLVIIKHVPADTTYNIPNTKLQPFVDACIKNFSTFVPDTIVVFVSYKPDKRNALYKFLESHAQHKHFTSLSETERINVIMKKIDSNIQIGADALKYFSQIVGSDMYRLHTEYDKLCTRAHIHNKTQINIQDVQKVTRGAIDTNIFSIFDYLFIDTNKIINTLDSVRDAGYDIQQVLGGLYRGISLLILLVDAYKHGETNWKSIATRISYPPFAVGKYRKRIQTFVSHFNDLKIIYEGLHSLDVSIKTGKVPEVAFRILSKYLFYTLGGNKL